MARLFSFTSWNIENFRGRQPRFDRVVDELTANGGPPDVFGIFEVRSSTTVFNEFTTRMPSHQFYITVTASSPIDTLVGVSRNFTAYYEQRDELQAGMPSLRPGALVTLTIGGQNYTLLFVHLKAMNQPVAWGLRDDMVSHIRSLKRRLDTIAASHANFVALGDYNTVGLNVTYANNDMTAAAEVLRYDQIFNVRNIIQMPKDHNVTLWGGPGSTYPPANVDHVYVADHLDIRPGDTGTGVRVRGWPERATDTQKGQWIRELSDHALIYGEVHQ